MPAWVGIVLFVLGIFLMILVHEAGHFVAARAFGIKVEEFFLGFGPRLWSFRRKGTEYGIKLLPLGGYVRIAGMNPFQEPAPEDHGRTFTSKPKWQRAIVLVAGGATHFVLAFLLLASFFWFIGLPVQGDRPEVAAVDATLEGEPSPAAEAGLRPGDVFISVDGTPIESVDDFGQRIAANAGEPLELVVERDGELVTITASPVLAPVEGERQGRLGIVMQPEVIGRDRSGPIEGVTDAGRAFGQMVVGSFRAMGQVFGPEGLGRIAELLTGGDQRRVDDPVGVVGAARFSAQAVEAGFFEVFLQLFAFFNVFVGILNLLPLPPLDGGHLAVLGIEAVTRRRIDPRKLVPITAVVAGFLILFTMSLLYLDLTAPIPNPFQ